MQAAESWLGTSFIVPRDLAVQSPIAAQVRRRQIEESTEAIDQKKLASSSAPPASVPVPPPPRSTRRPRRARAHKPTPVRWCQGFVDAWSGSFR